MNKASKLELVDKLFCEWWKQYIATEQQAGRMLDATPDEPPERIWKTGDVHMLGTAEHDQQAFAERVQKIRDTI